jgi:hypothetical protein
VSGTFSVRAPAAMARHEDLDQELGLGAQRVLGGELHVLDVAARQVDAPSPRVR